MPSWVTRLLVTALVAAVAGLAWRVGDGVAGIAYLVYYGLVTAPGWPVGWALFGRRHPAGWIAGALLGYALTTLVWWVPIAFGLPNRIAFALAWLLLVVTTAAVGSRVRSPLVVLPDWGRRETAALALVLLLVPALMGLPYSNLGRRDASGTRYYRAYFTADFVWHTALTAELAKFEWPPRNPYLASQPVHYYWTYMLVPAIASARGPAPVRNVQLALKVNALASGLLFFSIIFLAAWAAVPRAAAVASAVTLTALASSFEGTYAIWDLWRRGIPLAALKDINIDAISTWYFNGLRVDGLQRALWYVPQHSMAGGLGLVALAIAATGGVATSTWGIFLAGLALAAATAFNPFIGGVFCLGYGLAIAIDLVARRESPLGLARHLLAAAPVVLALGWVRLTQMLTDTRGLLQFGFTGPAAHSPVLTLFLSLGPVLVPAVLGLWPRRGLRLSSAAPAAATGAVGLFVAYTLVLTPDLFWVGFRGTQIFLLVVPALIARFFVAGHRPTRSRRLVAAAGVLLLLVGLPTTIVDTYNAQDINHRTMGPGFRWTIPVSRDQQAALTWIRENTPLNAVVSMEPTVRGRDTWSLIPTFAERRMPAGLAIPLLSTPEADARVAQVRELYETTDAARAWALARQLRIDYVYLDGTERTFYKSAASDKFGLHPEFFAPAFHNQEAQVFAVRQDR